MNRFSFLFSIEFPRPNLSWGGECIWQLFHHSKFCVALHHPTPLRYPYHVSGPRGGPYTLQR